MSLLRGMLDGDTVSGGLTAETLIGFGGTREDLHTMKSCCEKKQSHGDIVGVSTRSTLIEAVCF